MAARGVEVFLSFVITCDIKTVDKVFTIGVDKEIGQNVGDRGVKKHKKQFKSAFYYELHTNYYEVRKKRKFCGSIFYRVLSSGNGIFGKTVKNRREI